MVLKDKAVVVTGASSGIGRAIAVAFAQTGATLLLTGRSEARLQETKRLVEEKGAKARVVPADLSRADSINELIKTIKLETKVVDIFVHVAGIWHGDDKLFADTAYQDFSQKTVADTLMVGLMSPALLVHGLLPMMSKGGCLLAISGTFESGAKGWLPYYVAKRGLEDLWAGLAQELQDKDIRAYCISPSDTATDAYGKYFPQYMADAISPEEVADQAVRLSTTPASVDNVVWVVKKGQAPAPGFHR